jgi:hypothetical protein
MKTGVECVYELKLECHVTLNRSVNVDAYVKEIEKILTSKTMIENTSEKIHADVLTSKSLVEDRDVTIAVEYILTDYPDFFAGKPRTLWEPSMDPKFEYMDGEIVTKKMTDRIIEAFKAAGYERFDYKETYKNYDTEEKLFYKLEEKDVDFPDYEDKSKYGDPFYDYDV